MSTPEISIIDIETLLLSLISQIAILVQEAMWTKAMREKMDALERNLT